MITALRERQVKAEQEIGVALLRQHLKELGLDGCQPADLMKEFREVVNESQSLKRQAAVLNAEVHMFLCSGPFLL